MSISLIIPVYTVNEDLVKMTDRCLTSLFMYTPPNTEVVIVDDGSPVAYDTDLGRLIVMPENSGYVKAVNTALKEVKGDIIVLGNNDIVFHDNWLTELLFPINLGYDIATCWSSDQRDIKLEDRIEDRPFFGSLLALTREVYKELGGFDERFRGYFADTDYRRQAISHGFRIGKNCNMVIEHEAKATYAITDPDDYEFQRAALLYENKYGDMEYE